MKYLEDPEIGIPLLISIVSRTISADQSLNSPPFRKHVLSFSRLHLGMLYHINSIRFGKVVLKFQQFMQSNVSKFSDILSLETAIELCNAFFLPRSGQVCPQLHGESVGFVGIWYGQSSLKKCKVLENDGLVQVSSWNSAFTDEFPPSHDWRVPYPDPSFENYKLIHNLVESGHGMWVPKIEKEELVDVGYFTPFML